jgi:hypothetical protein
MYLFQGHITIYIFIWTGIKLLLLVHPQTVKKHLMVFVNCSIVSQDFKDLSKEKFIGNFLNSTVDPSENFFTEVWEPKYFK